jgi:hypothetical protein
MRRPSAAREALRFSPLVKAGWADASRLECVPLIAACAEPPVFLAGRPTAKQAADARVGGIVALVESGFAIYNRGQHGYSHNRSLPSSDGIVQLDHAIGEPLCRQ